jgi:succinyl-diaminopimelate desuccinylase
MTPPDRGCAPSGQAGHGTVDVGAVRRDADEDQAGVITLIQDLVGVPSRGGIDDYGPVLAVIADRLTSRGLPLRKLHDPTGQWVGVVCEITGPRPGPHYVLDACADTAPFGDPAAWRHHPTSAVIEDGWLYGRGAADSKAAIAIFSHLARRIHAQAELLHGRLSVLFDADEHTGNFGGAKAYFAEPGRAHDVDGVMIGYPGADQIVVGGRGFLRARITCHGTAAHTGSESSDPTQNAAVKAAGLITALSVHTRPGPVDPALELPPRLTVTAVHGGQGYSVLPDVCEIDVDVRLTTTYTRADAQTLIERAAADIDRQHPSSRPTAVTFRDSWPAYRLRDSSTLRAALTDAARQHLAPPPPARVAGPSNIGNYLAGLGIEATAGLGVTYGGLHATDERIHLASIPAIQAVYHHTVLTLLAGTAVDPTGRLRPGSA